MADPAFRTPPVHEGTLAVCSPDAVKFLQSQLTCNPAYSDDETPSFDCRCSIKGRLPSSFRILPEGDGLLLAMADELLEAQLADLKEYVVFSKASLVDENAAWLRIGLRDASEALRALGIDILVEGGRITRHGDLLVVALGDARVELWAPAQCAGTVFATLREHSRRVSFDDWLLGRVRAGVGQVLGATRELSIPQTINLQTVGGVSFKKGCYNDQEIIAHMQYLGRLKRRLYHLAPDVDEVPALGTGLFSSVYSTNVGEVVLAARTSENNVESLVALQDDAVADGWTSFGSAEGMSFVLLNLPYTLDNDCEIQCWP